MTASSFPGEAVALAAEIQSAELILSGTQVLSNVNLSLAPGKIHGLVGPGGGGKTLILKVLATLIKANSGVVRLFGEDIDHQDIKQLKQIRGKIGMQFQNLALFDFLTVGENVGFPLASSVDPESATELGSLINSALTSVHLPGTADMAVQDLSGGMQRRVAVARAVVNQPQLLLLDDPSGGLDPVTTSRIFALIKTIQEETNCTVVVASHDLDRLAHVCSEFHVVDRGTVIFSGSMEAGQGSPDPVVRNYLDVQKTG